MQMTLIMRCAVVRFGVEMHTPSCGRRPALAVAAVVGKAGSVASASGAFPQKSFRPNRKRAAAQLRRQPYAAKALRLDDFVPLPMGEELRSKAGWVTPAPTRMEA